jgi:hypothetical protein
MSINERKDKLISTLENIETYPVGWDGKDAKPATAKAVKEAKDFVYWLASRHKLLGQTIPHISLANDGEVNFWWKTERGVLDLGFYGTGTYTYYAKIHDSNLNDEFGDDNLPSKDIGFNSKLFAIIDRIR